VCINYQLPMLVRCLELLQYSELQRHAQQEMRDVVWREQRFDTVRGE
jgi:hypothetical protein